MEADLRPLRRLLSGRVLMLCHHNADPDSICAAYALKGLAEALNPTSEATIVAAGGVSRLSRRIAQSLGIETVEEAPLEGADALVILDAATTAQLGDVGERVASAEAPKVFIDHHAPHPSTARLASLHIADEDASSTCEIVYGLYRALGATPSSHVARALLVGIAYDSRRFTLGTATMFRAASELLEADGPLGGVVELLSSEMNRSERIARLKAAQRVRLREVEGWTVAASNVGSFQASASRALIALGADVAVVAGGAKGLVRASLRSSEKLRRATSIHLGRDLALPLGAEFGGVGGGHATSAGVNARGEVDPFIERAVELFLDLISGGGRIAAASG